MKKYWVLALLLPCVSGSALAAESADWADLQQQVPAAVFGEKCGMCHRAGGMGTTLLARRFPAEQAILENRRDLEPAFVEAVVRGGLGVMYPLSRGEVSDAQLVVIQQYLVKE